MRASERHKMDTQQMMSPRRLRARLHGPTIDWCRPVGFRTTPSPSAPSSPSGSTSPPKVALASFPGSGNTWLRYLLQQATGKVFSILYSVLAPFLEARPQQPSLSGAPKSVWLDGSLLVHKRAQFREGGWRRRAKNLPSLFFLSDCSSWRAGRWPCV